MLQTGEKPDIARFHRDKIQYKIHLTFSCASVRHIFVASRIILFYDTNPPMSLAFLAWPANCKNAQIVNFFSVVYLRCICLPEISSFYYSFLVFSFFLQWHIGGDLCCHFLLCQHTNTKDIAESLIPFPLPFIPKSEWHKELRPTIQSKFIWFSDFQSCCTQWSQCAVCWIRWWRRSAR